MFNFLPESDPAMIGQPDDLASMTPPPPPIKRVMVNWKADVCISDSMDSGISQTLTATTEVSQIARWVKVKI